MNRHRFTLDRQSFEHFLAAACLFQSLQKTALHSPAHAQPPLLQYSLETLRAVDSGTLDLQTALERVASLALQIVDGDSAAVWLFEHETLLCQVAAGQNRADKQARSALQSRLQSAGAFETNPPSTLDLTRTLEPFSSSLGSSLAIALLPGGGIAGVLAVFSDPPATFTQRNYSNLRLLAGLGQYVLTKWMARREQEPAGPSDLQPVPLQRTFFGTRIASSSERPATTPLIHSVPDPVPVPSVSMPDLDVSGLATGSAFCESTTGSLQSEPSPTIPASIADPTIELQSSDEHSPPDERFNPLMEQTSPETADRNSPPPQRWKQWKQTFDSRWDNWIAVAATQMQPLVRRRNFALDSAKDFLRRRPEVRTSWHEIARAVPAVIILSVMAFFAGLLTGGRQPLTAGSLNPVAQAAAEPVQHASTATQNENKQPALTEKKSASSPGPTSHLRITDRETAATIKEMSKYELRVLRQSASSGDDLAALELGSLYEVGHFLPQNCGKAAQWMTTAAQSGNVAAEYNLGLRYKTGDGVPINLEQSEIWLRKAAAHHDPDAARALAEPSTPTQL